MPRPVKKKEVSTESIVEMRAMDVMHARLDGAEFYDLKMLSIDKGWNVSERQLWRYVQRANEMIVESLEVDREKLINRHLAQRRKLYARAIQDGDLRTALAVCQDEAEMQSLYPPKRSEIAGKNGGPIRLDLSGLNDAELDEYHRAVETACQLAERARAISDSRRDPVREGTPEAGDRVRSLPA